MRRLAGKVARNVLLTPLLPLQENIAFFAEDDLVKVAPPFRLPSMADGCSDSLTGT